MARLILALLSGIIIAFAFTPVVEVIAAKVGAIDKPDGVRRIHDHPIPRLGGLAIFLGFLISTLLFVEITAEVRGILIGAVIIVCSGAVDDVVELKPIVKLVFQILAAIIAIGHGVLIGHLSNFNIFSDNRYLALGILSIPITLVWIVGVTNAVNLIDGLDGLACGVSTISCVTMLVVSLLVSEGNVAVILACLAGGCIGFIPFNLNPAKIFMGDTGSQLLGFVLATVSVLGLFKLYAIFTCFVPLCALAFPIFDTCFAFIRRILSGQSPFHPDKKHLHHRLMNMGLNQKQAVAVLYSISAIMGLVAVVAAINGVTKFVLIAVAVILAAITGSFLYKQHEKNLALQQERERQIHFDDTKRL